VATEGNRTTERRTDLLAIGLLVVLVTIFFADVLFGSSTFYTRDLEGFYFPTKAILRRIVLAGEFPWWNPYYSAGQPMAVNPEYAVFYPLQWLILLPNYLFGFNLHILVHIDLIAIGTYLLLRSFRLGAVASAFGAIAWALGGVVLSVITLLPTLFTAAWMPLLFLFIRRTAERFRWRDAAAAAICGGMQILAGDPAVLLETWAVIGGWALWRMWRHRPETRRTAAIFALLFAWSVAIGGVQLLPAIEFARHTPRAGGLSFESVAGWSFPPVRLLEIAQPYLFGGFDEGGINAWWGQRLYPQRASPFILRIYEGALLLPLLLAGLATRGTRRLEFALLAVPFFLLALGRNFFIVPWLYRLKVPVPLRFPERFLVIVVFVTVIYVSAVLDRIVGGDAVLRKRAMLAAIASAAVMAIVTLFTRTAAYERWFLDVTSTASAEYGRRFVELSRGGWLFALLVTTISAALLIAIRLRPASVRLWGGAILAALALELLATSLQTIPRITDHFYDPPPVTATLDPHRDRYRIFHQMAWYEYTRWSSGYRKTGNAAIWAQRNAMIPMLPAAWGYRTVLEQDYDLTLLRPTTDFVAAMWTLVNERRAGWERFFLPISNVHYVAVPRPVEEELRRIGGDARAIEPADFIAVPALPRYFFANAIRRVRGADEFVRDLQRGIPDPRTAFADLEPFAPAPARVVAVDEHSSWTSLRTISAGRSFLVASITPDDHWRATIDGVPAPLHVTDIGYQGLIVPAGEHRIDLRYRNSLTIAFGAVSLLAFAAALLTKKGSGL